MGGEQAAFTKTLLLHAPPRLLHCPCCADVAIHSDSHAGALDGVGAAFAMHVWPMQPSGTVQSRAGTIMVG